MSTKSRATELKSNEWAGTVTQSDDESKLNELIINKLEIWNYKIHHGTVVHVTHD